MIEHKKEIFAQGIGIFANQFCKRVQRSYIAGMVHENGYLHAAKEFYKHTGYLTVEDRDNLFKNDVIPEWMTNIIAEVEQDLFGQTFIDKR